MSTSSILQTFFYSTLPSWTHEQVQSFVDDMEKQFPAQSGEIQFLQDFVLNPPKPEMLEFLIKYSTEITTKVAQAIELYCTPASTKLRWAEMVAKMSPSDFHHFFLKFSREANCTSFEDLEKRLIRFLDEDDEPVSKYPLQYRQFTITKKHLKKDVDKIWKWLDNSGVVKVANPKYSDSCACSEMAGTTSWTCGL